ncbi:MAG: GGDEF domain-containing protein [Gammaproteobacteria bacterium]|nr:MAG: GGDEF domain-containing protein [Gammaproteobacteria bacterium]
MAGSRRCVAPATAERSAAAHSLFDCITLFPMQVRWPYGRKGGVQRRRMAEQNDEQRQALRLRRSLIGMIGSLAFVMLAWAARENGLVHVSGSVFGSIFAPWLLGYAGFVGLILSGRNLRLSDPSCTVAQVVWAALGPLLLYPMAPELAVLCYLALVSAGLFGAFRLDPRRYLALNFAIVLLVGAGFVFNLLFWPDIGDTMAATLAFAAFLVAMAVVTAAGLELNSFRRVLMERNEQLTQAFERLRDMSIRDELTGIHNRRFLMDVLQQQKAQHDRREEHVFSVAFVDLDHFKRVNDVFGHSKGDLVLKRFAEVAAKAVRQVDYVARFGGEEFVLVLVGTPKENAVLVAERIRRQMAALPISDELPDFRISASFGISQHMSGESIEDTLARADAALYDAKHTGRNRVVLAPDPSPGAATAAGDDHRAGSAES